jgi:hypothetical protein
MQQHAGRPTCHVSVGARLAQRTRQQRLELLCAPRQRGHVRRALDQHFPKLLLRDRKLAGRSLGLALSSHPRGMLLCIYSNHVMC